MKICASCKEEKELSGFKKNAKCKGGVVGKCKVCVNTYQKGWRMANPNHPKGNRSEVRARYYDKNKEDILECSKTYRENNLPKYAFYAMKRHTTKLNATPSWLTKNQLREIATFYEVASWYSEPMHVDHIIPLQGKKVCGLHVPWNLQVIPAVDNIRKGNRFENDIA